MDHICDPHTYTHVGSITVSYMHANVMQSSKRERKKMLPFCLGLNLPSNQLITSKHDRKLQPMFSKPRNYSLWEEQIIKQVVKDWKTLAATLQGGLPQLLY